MDIIVVQSLVEISDFQKRDTLDGRVGLNITRNLEFMLEREDFEIS